MIPSAHRGSLAATMRRRTALLPTLLAMPLLVAFMLDRLFPLPLPDAERDAASVVLAHDGTPLRAFADRDGVWRYPVTPEDVSPLYLEALLTYEDRWFHLHRGINPLAMWRAVMQAVWHREIVSGGSTLTMQVARLIEPIPHTGIGKIRQMLRALQLEWHLDKREILTLYLNYAPFGGTLQGVQAASYGYLGKPAAELSHAEAALLAVLPQAPSRLRPDRWPERARTARDKVLVRMVAQRAWDETTAADARRENVVARQLQIPQLAALAAQRLRSAHPRARRIETTLDADLQSRIEARVADWVERLPPRTSAAVIVTDTRTMQVRAYVGAARFGDDASFGHVDMARAWRSPGSTLKPFLYGMALDDGLIHSESLLVDAPQEFGKYRPGNFDERFRGPISAREALQQSLNVPAVALLDAIGPARFSARLAHAGTPLRLPRGAEPTLALILGGTEARLEDLVGIYAALHRDGLAARPRLSADAPLEERRLFSPGAAWIVRQTLAENARPGALDERVDTSRRASLAWKTGTSYGFRDAWAIAAAPGATIGVWIGRPDGTPLPGQYGAITALPLLFAINDVLPRTLRATAQPMPSSVAIDTICWPLGQRESTTDPAHCVRRHAAWILDGTVPPTLPSANQPAPAPITYRRDAITGHRLAGACSAQHAESLSSIAPWPALVHPWLTRAERRQATLPPLASDCTAPAEPMRTLRIAGIVDGTVLRSPSNRADAPEVSVRALGAIDDVDWLIDGRRIAGSRNDAPVQLRFDQTGPQRLLAIDSHGRYAYIDIRVLR
ncbi:penicillin-binding protein 1C [Xanthomonadaceae bacterium XH05]|nr:penicillin-binding protein 1C [Xanthomonadaceae bacterium XH05]